MGIQTMYGCFNWFGFQAENATFSSSYGLYGASRSALTGTLDRNFTNRTPGHGSIPARSLSTQHITSSGNGAGPFDKIDINHNFNCVVSVSGMMGSPSARRMRQLLELGSRGGVMGVSGPSPVPTPSSTLPRNRHVDINTSGNFLKLIFINKRAFDYIFYLNCRFRQIQDR